MHNERRNTQNKPDTNKELPTKRRDKYPSLATTTEGTIVLEYNKKLD